MTNILFGDFESQSRVDLRKSGADVYARDPYTRVMAFGAAFNDEDVVVTGIGERPSKRVVDHVRSGGLMVAHNAPFEWVIWNHTFRREFPDLPELKREQLICTMAMAYAMAMPGSLEFAAAAAGIDMQKDMEGYRVMMKLCKPKDFTPAGAPIFWSPYEYDHLYQRMYKYCGVDVGVERFLYKRLTKLSSQEKAVWKLDHVINQRGVSIDLKAVQNAISLVEIEKKRLDKEMQEITGFSVATCSSVVQLTDWLKSKGVECDGIAKNDVADLLADPILPEDCRRALLLRQEAAKSSNAKLSAMLSGVCDDGRTRGLFQYHGAGTGRWAGRRIQLQNLPRPRLKQNEINEVFDILRGIGG